ncbi:MAG TPA: putative peptidoglycan glycosyltransferase FtsW [Terracidiphilus sp.]|jgi:cell division protein FtsW
MAKRVAGDKWIFFTTVLLIVVGLAMVFSASAVVAAQGKFHSPYAFVGKQALWALTGLAFMLLLARLDYTFYKSPRFIYIALSVTTTLLVLVYRFPESNYAHRWIRFSDFFTLQPSEIVKPVMVLFLAWFLSNRLDQINQWSTLWRASLIPLIFISLIVFEPDLGTALVLAGVTAMMLFLAGLAWRYLVGGIFVSLPVLALLLIGVSWRLQRIRVYERFLLHPDCDLKDLKEAGAAGYHTCQSLIAVGSGGVTGLGYMDGQQKLFFLPEVHTDFIFANIAEEMGLIGAILLLFLFAYFGYRGLRTAYRSQDPFARLTAFGITTAIVLQAFFNISVVIALLPTKGIPLPLISSGGTSLVFTLASIGILLNISRKVD